jgi:hypothetical protein
MKKNTMRESVLGQNGKFRNFKNSQIFSPLSVALTLAVLDIAVSQYCVETHEDGVH